VQTSTGTEKCLVAFMNRNSLCLLWQSADDVRFIRRVLNEAGGQAVKIISKIENQEGLQVVGCVGG
jgi:hypothetical protein